MSITVNLNNASGTGTTAFTEQTPVVLFPSAALSTSGGTDNNSIDRITVVLGSPSATKSLSLSASAQTLATSIGVTVSYDAATGTLTLQGSNEQTTNWQTILQGIVYNDTSDAPTNPGTITVTAQNTGFSGGTGTDTHAVSVTAVNDAPVNQFGGETHTNADAFASANYGLNTGTDNWAGSWTETNDNSNASSGLIQVTGGQLRLTDSDSSSNAQMIQRQVAANLANATSATLSFDYTSLTNATSDNIDVQISTNGSSWTSLGTIGGNGADGHFSQSITNYISGTTSIRFVVAGSITEGEFIYLDNVNVSYDIYSASALPKQSVNWLSNPHVLFSSANNTAIRVSDVDSSNFTVTLNVTAGTLTLASTSGLTVTGNGTNTVTLSGSTANINTALNGLDYATTSHNLVVGNVDDTLTITTNDGSGGTDTDTVQFDVICFYAGTRVRTPSGEVAVETLKRGDEVLTSDGRAMPVTWLGRQTVSTVFGDPLRVLPIRIKAGALGENLPARDLLVSPDHAILVDGALVQAGALVNGASIVREKNVPKTFTYYHVELDDHSLILAENVPAETFIDNVERLAFDNWAEHQALYPQGKPITELPYPRAKSHRQVPVNIRVKLADRAQAIGAVEKTASVA